MLDPVALINSAFWSLVLPLANVADPPVRCINPAATDNDLETENDRAPNDFPQLRLEQQSDNFRSAIRPVFGSLARTDYPVTGRVTFNVNVKMDQADVTVISGVMALVRKALMAQYPHMGIAQIGFTVTNFYFDPSRFQKVRGEGAGNTYVSPFVVEYRARSTQVIS